MAIEKISDSTISANGVISAPDTLTGTAAENKAVFDRLTGKTAIPKVNEVIDEVNRLTGQDVFTARHRTARLFICGSTATRFSKRQPTA